MINLAHRNGSFLEKMALALRTSGAMSLRPAPNGEGRRDVYGTNSRETGEGSVPK